MAVPHPALADVFAAVPRAGLLAGYPRSGAARVRAVLAHCFGCATASLYDETDFAPDYGRLLGAVDGSPLSEGGVPEIARRARAQGLFLYKTHEPATRPFRGPVVVIVRDGRYALRSLKAFYRSQQEVEYDWAELVEGRHPWGCWSSWVRSWAAWAPPDALWLRYEDTMADLPGCVDRIARRFSLEPVAREIPPFEEFRRVEPTVFREAAMPGSVESGMTPEDEDLFWRLHGGAMSLLGYARGGAA